MVRRDFIKYTGMAAAGLGLSGFTAPKVFANGQPGKKIVIAIAGVNSRGNGMARTFARQPNCEVAYVCDVDERAMAKTIDTIAQTGAPKPKAEKDFRKALEDKGVDAIYFATPDHWHAPGSIIACTMGKHVYVEKPISHNPREGELLVEAARKYNRIVQLGTQRRSGSGLIQMMADIRSGIIGNVYMAKTWYTNRRQASTYKDGPVPSWLDWDLWQGPAPRRPYKEGYVHYDWHWKWHWGTGEALNNGTHEVDVARWGVGVEFPIKVASIGGRYAFDDEWETPDTQTISLDFPEKKMIFWESRSCNNFRVEGADRGVIFYGTNGTIINPGGNSYTVYNNRGEKIKDSKDATDSTDTTNTVSPGENLDVMHVANFLECIREGKTPTAEIEIGFRSTLLVQLGNVAWRSGQTLNIDSKNGHILNPGLMDQYWAREYEKGWEPKI
jgi:predicted dehydrogenase